MFTLRVTITCVIETNLEWNDHSAFVTHLTIQITRKNSMFNYLSYDLEPYQNALSRFLWHFNYSEWTFKLYDISILKYNLSVVLNSRKSLTMSVLHCQCDHLSLLRKLRVSRPVSRKDGDIWLFNIILTCYFYSKSIFDFTGYQNYNWIESKLISKMRTTEL